MPAHKTEKITIQDLGFWQPIWKLLVVEDFLLIPKELEKRLRSETKTFTVGTKTFGHQEMKNFHQGVEILQKIQNLLAENKEEIDSLEWNYLGRSSEKDIYLQYLEDIFWQNQNSENIQNLPNLRNIIDSPWKIVQHARETNLYIKPPFEFFSEKTAKFLEKLEQDLEDWDFNPYLVCNCSGSFHWKLKVDKKYSLVGYIYKDENDSLIHDFTFQNLTKTD